MAHWTRICAFRRKMARKLIEKWILNYIHRQRNAMAEEIRRLEEIARQEELDRLAREAANEIERARLLAEKLRLQEEEHLRQQALNEAERLKKLRETEERDRLRREQDDRIRE